MADSWRDLEKGGDISDRRYLFIAKTFATVAMQLLIIFIVCIGCYHSPKIMNMSPEGQSALVWASFAICLVSMIVMICCVSSKNLCIAFPFFIVSTICLGFMTAMAVIQYEASIVIQAIIITAIATFACCGYVLLTKVNLHSLHGILFFMLMLSVISGFVFIIFPPSDLIQIVYAIIGIIIFVGYLLVDTSDIIHNYEEHEWMIAAMNVTLDIINLMLKILALLDKCKKN